MRVGFAGTPRFAVAALEAIVTAGFDVPVVLTRPDKPKGRGLALQPSDVKAFAVARGLPLRQPPSLKSADAQAMLLDIPLDVLVVAAYGLILPAVVLGWPRHGALNIHASLLPRWRGAAPVQRAILAGDKQTGVTIMQMDEGLDTGAIVSASPVMIGRQTAGELLETLARTGASAIVESLRHLEREGALPSTPQPVDGVTYASKVEREDAAIDWAMPADQVDRQVRAFDPSPGAFTYQGSALWKIWRAEPRVESLNAVPGTLGLIDGDLVVACGHGALAVHELQPAGGKRMSAAAAIAGRRLAPGDAFASALP